MPMLADDVQTAVIRVTVQGAEVTADAIRAVLKALAERKKTPRFKRGYQSLKQLNKQNVELSASTVPDQDMIALKKELKEYGVDFAITQGDAPNTSTIFFKTKDHEQFNVFLSNYWKRSDLAKSAGPSRPSIRERIQMAVEKAKNINEKMQKTFQKAFKRNRDKAL